MPDRRFLAAVQAQLDRVRPIGTRVKVIPPVYVELSIRVSLRGLEEGGEEALAADLREFLAASGIGGTFGRGMCTPACRPPPACFRCGRWTCGPRPPAVIRTGRGTSGCPARPSPC